MANPVLTRRFGEDAQTETAPHIVDSGDRMTVSGVIRSAGVYFLLLLAGAVYGWNTLEDLGGAFWLGLIAMIVLAIAIAVRPKLVVALGPVYAVAVGVLLGGISKIYNDQFEGIVLQAVMATMAVFVAMLFLYGNRIIKVTARMRSTIILATAGIMVFYLASILLSLFGVNIPLVWEGGPLSIAISLFIVGIAAFNLLLDFDLIERGVAAGEEKWMNWFGAFALVVTLVWLYLEILRLISYFRD